MLNKTDISFLFRHGPVTFKMACALGLKKRREKLKDEEKTPHGRIKRAAEATDAAPDHSESRRYGVCLYTCV